MLWEKQRLLGLPQNKLKTDICTQWNNSSEMVYFLEQKTAEEATLRLKVSKRENMQMISNCDFFFTAKITERRTKPVRTTTAIDV